MAQLAPTINSTHYSGVFGDKKVKAISATIAGTVTDASSSDGGALLTPALVGFTYIDYVHVVPKFSEDSIEEYAVSYGPADGGSSDGWVISVLDKDDNLETDDSTAITGVTFHALVIGS